MRKEYFRKCKAGLTKEGKQNMGFRVKEIREARNMTQEELERKSGISRQTISAIENGKVKPGDVKVGTLMALASALNTTIDSIFFEQAV